MLVRLNAFSLVMCSLCAIVVYHRVHVNEGLSNNQLGAYHFINIRTAVIKQHGNIIPPACKPVGMLYKKCGRIVNSLSSVVNVVD